MKVKVGFFAVLMSVKSVKTVNYGFFIGDIFNLKRKLILMALSHPRTCTRTLSLSLSLSNTLTQPVYQTLTLTHTHLLSHTTRTARIRSLRFCHLGNFFQSVWVIVGRVWRWHKVIAEIVMCEWERERPQRKGESVLVSVHVSESKREREREKERDRPHTSMNSFEWRSFVSRRWKKSSEDFFLNKIRKNSKTIFLSSSSLLGTSF